MDDADKVIEVFVEWFMREGFHPARDYRNVKEPVLVRDMLRQLESWNPQDLRGWKAIEREKPFPVGPFGHRYETDIELVHDDARCVPIEVELMKDGAGWKPAEAVGQAIMFSRRSDAGKAIAAILDVRTNPPAEGETEQKLKVDLWEKFGVRLCVRRGG